MLSRLFLILFCVFIYTPIFSQGEFVVEINPETGSYTKETGVLPNVLFVYPDDITINENTGTYIFASSQSENRLFSINTDTGAVVNNPLTPNTFQGYRYNNTTNTLYALQRDPVNFQVKFGSIDPVSGVFTIIGNPLAIPSTYSGALSAYDSTLNNYSFITPPGYTLNHINASDASVISTVALPLGSGEVMGGLVYHPTTGVLYGLQADFNVQKFFLVTIDPVVGTITKIGSGSVYGTSAASTTIDLANQRFIYCYGSGTEGGYAITTLDINTGNVLYNHLLAPFSSMDNFNSVSYDNTQQKLFALHYDKEILGIENAVDFAVKIYPNPVSDIVIISSLVEANYRIVSLSGQTLGQGKLSMDDNVINVQNLETGVYFIIVETPQGKINHKIIKY